MVLSELFFCFKWYWFLYNQENYRPVKTKPKETEEIKSEKIDMFCFCCNTCSSSNNPDGLSINSNNSGSYQEMSIKHSEKMPWPCTLKSGSPHTYCFRSIIMLNVS